MIRVENTHLPVAALTHPGMKGKNNEDRFGVSAFRLKGHPDRPVLLAVLSDGVGGNRAGEVASELAVNLTSQYVAESDGDDPVKILQQAIQSASQQIYQQAQENQQQRGMGATCACAWVSGDRLYTATVGDSRVYLMHDGTIQQLSTDHTWVQEALERGLIEPAEVVGHPNAHVIRRYLGSQTPPVVDFRIRLNEEETEGSEKHQGLTLAPNDCILLCSDGLTDLVQPEEILAAFQQYSLDEAGRQLIDLANQRGGHDNITLIAIQLPEVQSASREAPKTALSLRTRNLVLGCLGVVLFAALVGGLAGGWLLYSDQKFSPTSVPELIETVTPTQALQATQPFSPTFTPMRLSSPLPTAITPTVGQLPGLAATLTPWPTNTLLPIVTVSP